MRLSFNHLTYCVFGKSDFISLEINVFSFYFYWGYFVFYCISSWKKYTFYIAYGFRRSWCFYRSHLLTNIENVFVVNCSTYLSIYYRYSAFCSGSLPVLRVSILAARQYSTRYNFRTYTFKCHSQFRFTVQLAVVYWFRHHSLYSVITGLRPNGLVQKWNKHHWLSGHNEPILSRSNQRTPRLTTLSRPLLEDPVVSQTVEQISRM
jgi:hypothetical protein